MEFYDIGVWLIIGVTILVSWRGLIDVHFTNRYLFWPEAVLGGKEQYRLLSSGFLHADLVHLMMNMITLYFFGPMIEGVFGHVLFLVIYLGAIAGGNLLALYLHRHHDYRALGASGGVSGIMLAAVLVSPYAGVCSMILPFYIPGWLYALLYLATSFYGIHRRADNIGHDAHLGGALTGLFLAAAMQPVLILRNPLWFAIMTVAAGAMLIYFIRNPMLLPIAGLDFTRERWSSPAWDWRGLFRRKSKTPRNVIRPEAEMDAILEKVSKHGMASLSERERQILQAVSGKHRRRAQRIKPRWYLPF